MGEGSPPLCPGAEPPVEGSAAPKAHSILRIFGCQIMHNFVYLAKVHESLVKCEKTSVVLRVCLQSCQVFEIHCVSKKNKTLNSCP